MVLPISNMANLGLVRAHKIATRVRVFHGQTEVTPDGGLPLVDGDVQANLSNRVTRTASIQVPFEYFPHEPDDLLSPYRATILIETGIEYLDGSQELWPVFKGRIYDATLSGDGAVTLRADDLAADVLAFRFEQPFSVQQGYSIFNMIELLISDAIDNPQFGPHDAFDAFTPSSLTWDEDRGRALDDLAAAINARWYTLGDGTFVIRKLPYIEDVPFITLSDGEDNLLGGLVSAAKSITRDSTANSITVVSERTDGSAPIIARRRDTLTGSPTEFGGLFGKVSQILRPQTPLTASEADQLAQAQLGASLSLVEQWNLVLIPIPFLEPGDAVRIRYRGVQADQIIDAMSIPLTTSGNMTIRTRGATTAPAEATG